MKVRYRKFEELLFNVKTYHAESFRKEYIPKLRQLAGTEVDVNLRPAGTAVRLESECGLPVFDVISSLNQCVCAHMCEID